MAQAAIFGGKITPEYEAPAAKWVSESEPLLRGPYGVRDLRRPSFVALGRRRPAALRGEFRDARGRAAGPSVRPRARLRLGKKQLCRRRNRRNCKGVGIWRNLILVPNAAVKHFVTKDMQNDPSHCQVFSCFGGNRRPAGRPRLGAPRKLWPLKSWLRYRYHRLGASLGGASPSLCQRQGNVSILATRQPLMQSPDYNACL